MSNNTQPTISDVDSYTLTEMDTNVNGIITLSGFIVETRIGLQMIATSPYVSIVSNLNRIEVESTSGPVKSNSIR